MGVMMNVTSRTLAVRTVIAFVVSCVCFAPWHQTARGGELQAGAAMRVITPNPLLPVSGGMGIPKPTREKKGDITARAVAFRNGDVTVAIVALDLLGFPSALGDRIRNQVSRIPADHVLIGSLFMPCFSTLARSRRSTYGPFFSDRLMRGPARFLRGPGGTRPRNTQTR